MIGNTEITGRCFLLNHDEMQYDRNVMILLYLYYYEN